MRRLEETLGPDRQAVVQGVFVGAVDQGVIGQCGDAGKGVVHLSGSPFEQPSTAGGEKGISAKECPMAVVTEVSPGVAGGLHDREGQTELGQFD